MPNAKLFLGQRLRRLRKQQELSQTDMAATLGISPSYLNHLERNQRPVTAALLLKLAERYDIDVRTFAAGGGQGLGADELAEIFSDILLQDLGVPRYELAELANNAPSVADAIARLYAALKEAHREGGVAAGGDARAVLTPENWVRDYIQQHRNHYPKLEEAAETLGGALRDPLSMAEPMRRRLRDAWGVNAKVVPQAELGNLSQLFDKERRQFLLSSQLKAENRTFGLAYQLALIEFGNLLDRMVVEAAPPDEGIAQLLHMHLANYAAGAIMMPYGRFLYRLRGDAIFDRPAERRIRRQCRADRASLHDFEPPWPARRAILHASGRSGRQHLETLCRRSISRSAASAAPVRVGICTPPSRPPGRLLRN